MIEILIGALEDMDAAAVVRPVATDFSPVTPAMRRFDEVAGPEVAAQSRRVGEIPLGAAVITAGGDLRASIIVHVAVRDVTENVSRAIVRTGFLNALRRAAEWEASTLAVAPLGTGAGNLDAETAADAMLDGLAAHFGETEGPDRIILVVEDAYQEAAFTGAVERYLGRTADTP